MKKLNLFIIMISFIVVISSSCSENKIVDSGEKSEYVYSETKVYPDINILKTVYKDNTMKIYYESGGFSKDSKAIFYDDKFNEINDLEYVFTDKVLTVNGDAASDVSGIEVEIDYGNFEIRYLKSDKFASLSHLWADDAGYLTYGDEESFYTPEEISLMKQREDERLKKLAENFALIEGKWKSVDGTFRLRFYEKDNDYYIDYSKYNIENDEWETTTTYIENITSSYDSYLGELEIGVTCNDFGPCMMYSEFIINDDGTTTYEDSEIVKDN